MKCLLITSMCFFLSACAYTSATMVALSAKQAKAVSTVPVDIEDGDAKLKRYMHLHLFCNCNKPDAIENKLKLVDNIDSEKFELIDDAGIFEEPSTPVETDVVEK